MPINKQDAGSNVSPVPKLERQIRILEKRVARSEQSRKQLEDAKDRFDALYQRTINELDEHKDLLEKQNSKLESLSSKLAKYLAPQIFQSIFSGDQEVSLETKRKKLTVFFSDIKDFTQITEDLQAEDLASLLNEYFTEMSQIAHQHGGTIDKFIGDAMLIFFGDPETKGVEKDAISCVKMALAMQQRMSKLQEVWREKGYERPFQMRIGVNTGFCNVGNFGSEHRMDYTIIGGEVNLAARLEQQAAPDGILISYETFALVRNIVEAEEEPSIEAKGIRREIRPFAVRNILGKSRQEEHIHWVKDGITIHIDFDHLSQESRRSAKDKLSEIMERLKN